MIGPMRLLCIGVLTAGALASQSTIDRDKARVEELDRHARELEDLIQRHTRGEDVSRSRWLELDKRIGGEDQKTRETLRLTESETRAMREELSRLQALRAARKTAKEQQEEGDARPRREETDRSARPEPESPRAAAGVTAVTPGVAPTVMPKALTDTIHLQGSTDHRRVGLALLRAGLDLRAEARLLASQGRVAAAAAQDELANSKLKAALAELDPLGSTDDAGPADVFALARCHEAVGNLDRADDLYTEVMARDRQEVAGVDSGLGQFGRAAATARAVLSWLRESGAWRPRRNVDDLEMPKR